MTEKDGKEYNDILLSKPINITIDLLDISVPISAPPINFVLKKRKGNCFYLEELL